MTHWQRFSRLYTAILIFVSANAVAASEVFGGLSPEQLAAMSHRMIAVEIIKCVAIASGTLLTYIIPQSKTNPPVP